MKKCIKKLLYSSLVAFIGIGINFDAEARLPKYMARRAAELLIEKSGLVLNGENVTNKVQKRREFAEKLVNFLYSTEKRQHLANWFRSAYKRDIRISEASQDIQGLFTKLSQVTAYTYINGNFINNRFPCWTGTLTCFMLDRNNLAYQILSHSEHERSKEVYLKYKDGTSIVNIVTASSAQKIIHVLFLLELIDTWDDVKKITESEEESPLDKVLERDPYECVSVPNTMYGLDSSKDPQGSCMISTIKNLLCVLCQNSNQLYFYCNLKDNVRDFINYLNTEKKGDFFMVLPNQNT